MVWRHKSGVKEKAEWAGTVAQARDEGVPQSRVEFILSCRATTLTRLLSGAETAGTRAVTDGVAHPRAYGQVTSCPPGV